MTKSAHSDTGSILKIILKHPRDAFKNQEQIDSQWQKLNYLDCPNFQKSVDDYNKFVEIIKTEADEIIYLPNDDITGLDSIYVRDAMLSTESGIIICNMGKDDRKTEPSATEQFLSDSQISILGSITGDGILEGGDFIWLDSKTAAIGLGYRTNEEGIEQFKQLTSSIVDDVIVVHLPHWDGQNDVFHLMSIISPIDSDLAVVYSRLMPVVFRNNLLERGIKLVEVPDKEFDSMGCNILALAPRKCLMIDGNPITKQRLENEGVEVLTYDGSEISLKGSGGPTCLTRPLIRTV
jgi:N-dimethylarginine dimethylaminohydrolase